MADDIAVSYNEHDGKILLILTHGKQRIDLTPDDAWDLYNKLGEKLFNGQPDH